MAKYKAIILGFGERGKTILKITQEHVPDIHITGAYDPNPEARARAEEAGLKAYSDANTAFYQSGAMIAFVTSNVADHCEGVTLAATHGCHIFVEKPLATSPDEADRMVKAVDDAGVVCTVDFETPFSDSFAILQRELAREEFGQLVWISAVDKGRVPAYDIETCMPHFLHLFETLMGSRPVEVSGRVILGDRLSGRGDIVPINSIGSKYARRPHDNPGMNATMIHASYLYGNGVWLDYNLARLDEEYVADPTHFKPGSEFMHFVLHGSRGQIKWHQTKGGYVYRKNTPQDTLNEGAWQQVYAPEKPDGTWEIPTARLIQNFVDCIKRNVQPATSIYAARRIVEQVSGIYASHLSGGSPVVLPLVNRRNPLL